MPAATGQWVLAYYVGYEIDKLPIAQIDWTALTHIAFSPMTVNSDGTLDLSFDDTHGAAAGPTDAMALATAAHQHGVRAILMLGGAGNGPAIAAQAVPANRAAFVTRILGALDQLGYDGVDLDWEESVNLDDMIGLAQALRQARPSIVLTYPGGMVNSNFQTVDARFGTLAQSLDRFFVQSYYPSTAVAGSGWNSWFLAPVSGVTAQTPIAADDTLSRYEAAGVPHDKLGIGTGFYAICYTGGITAPRQPTDGTSQKIVGGDGSYPLSALFAAGGTFETAAAGSKLRDATALEPYLSLPSPVADSHCGASTQYISYEDETSIIAKGTWSKQNGYAGIIIWTLSQGTDATRIALRTGFLQ
jgi:chitinase